VEKNFLVKLAVPVVALSLLTACGGGGNGDQQDPTGQEAPMNQEDDNGQQNPAEEPSGETGDPAKEGNGQGQGQGSGDQPAQDDNQQQL